MIRKKILLAQIHQPAAKQNSPQQPVGKCITFKYTNDWARVQLEHLFIRVIQKSKRKTEGCHKVGRHDVLPPINRTKTLYGKNNRFNFWLFNALLQSAIIMSYKGNSKYWQLLVRVVFDYMSFFSRNYRTQQSQIQIALPRTQAPLRFIGKLTAHNQQAGLGDKAVV